MRYNLYLLQYNNYYNRQLKILPTVEDYEDYLVASIMDCNVDIKDEINTSIIINYKNDLATPNYLLIEEKIIGDGGLITTKFTRWFVIECVMTRGLQYSLNIRRDVIADYYDTIKKSPCIIQKGYVDNNNVLVFNQEGQQYNKVKTQELLIKDHTGIGYVVGFVGKDSNYVGKIKTTYSQDLQIDFDYDALSTTEKDWCAIGSATPNQYFIDRKMTSLEINSVGVEVRTYNNKFAQNDGKIKVYSSYINTDFNVTVSNASALPNDNVIYEAVDPNYIVNMTPTSARTGYFEPMYNEFTTITRSKLNNYVSRTNLDFYRSCLGVPAATYNSIWDYNGQITKISGVYYRAQVRETFTATGNTTNSNYTLYTYIKNSLPTSADMLGFGQYSSIDRTKEQLALNDIVINYNQYNVYIQLVPINQKVYTNLTDKDTRLHLIDNPYDMFVIPYDNEYVYEVNNTNYTANKNMAINLAQAICEASGSKTYDIQIVPYCPFNIEGNDWSLLNGEAIYEDTNNNNDDTDDTIIGFYFWADKSSINFSVAETRTALTLADNPSYKEITQLYKYILCSPDKAAQYEFNPAMNQGITKWNISLDYRPYSSYVKVQPSWNYLYGQEYYNNSTDYRGLIFNGSYSLTQLNDAWANYLNSNKNYQQIFDTQINTQLTKFNMNQEAQWDTVGMRNFSFNPIKAVLGIVGENKQMDFDRQIMDVDLSAQRALFNYQIDNIQNQPDTIRKLTSINIDFKIFPYVEIYEATDQEKLLFRDNIKYNGMTIMATGYIENYLKPNDETFIKATLIRFSEFSYQENDFTLVQNINYELNKGIYIETEE